MIGVVVIGGIILATLLTLFLVPALYLLLARFTRPSGEVAARLRDLEREDAAGGSGSARPSSPFSSPARNGCGDAPRRGLPA